MRFGGVTAVDDVSFTVSPGEVIGLIGPNGAGKTTVLDVITGFTRQQAGSRAARRCRRVERGDPSDAPVPASHGRGRASSSSRS